VLFIVMEYMKSIDQRTWCGDFEIIYRGSNGYEHILSELEVISDNVIGISCIQEEWMKVQGKLDIMLTYITKTGTNSILTGSSNDYFNISVLFFLNLQQKLKELKFECSMSEQSVYFITEAEKTDLENQGIKFERLDVVSNVPSIVHNILHNPDSELKYQLTIELNNSLEEYYFQNLDAKNSIIHLQQLLRTKLIPALDWESISKLKIETENIHNFINKNIT